MDVIIREDTKLSGIIVDNVGEIDQSDVRSFFITILSCIKVRGNAQVEIKNGRETFDLNVVQAGGATL